MILLLPVDQTARLIAALEEAGRREVGGILMGEHVGPDTFKVVDLTCQTKGGTFASFLRKIEDLIAPLRAFFVRTNHDYKRFNYLGEWHSHHSFALAPSSTDHRSMIEIVNDPSVGARFAVLLLVRLNAARELGATVTVYQPRRAPCAGEVRFGITDGMA